MTRRGTDQTELPDEVTGTVRPPEGVDNWPAPGADIAVTWTEKL